MSNVVSRCCRPLRLRSRPGVLAARRCIARRPYGVEGAPTPLARGVHRDADRFADGVAVATKRLGVRTGRRWSCNVPRRNCVNPETSRKFARPRLTVVKVVSPRVVSRSEISEARDDRRERGLGVDIAPDQRVHDGPVRVVASSCCKPAKT